MGNKHSKNGKKPIDNKKFAETKKIDDFIQSAELKKIGNAQFEKSKIISNTQFQSERPRNSLVMPNLDIEALKKLEQK